MNHSQDLEMMAPESSHRMVSVRKIAITTFDSRGGAMKLTHHASGPLLPMPKLLIREGGCEGVMPQSLMSATMSLTVNSSQRAGFGLTELELPVDCGQHLTQ